MVISNLEFYFVDTGSFGSYSQDVLFHWNVIVFGNSIDLRKETIPKRIIIRTNGKENRK